MRLLAAIALAIVAAGGTAQAQEAQPPADAYRACLVGNTVIALLEEGYEDADATFRALALCDYMVPDVPDALAVEEAFIALWDERLADLLIPADE